MAMKKSVKSVKKVNVKRGDCPCGCGCGGSCGCHAGDSVKYTSIWAAWRAFWRRGFTEWAGTSSRSEYWLSGIGNVIILGLLVLITALFFMNFKFLFNIMLVVSVMYTIALIIPTISMTTRRMHDTGLSAWMWLVLIVGYAPILFDETEIAGGVIESIIALLPTQLHNNPYHKNNK